MYEIDQKDRVEELTEIPQSSIGAPMPVVLASECKVAVAYYCENREDDWDGSSIKIVDSTSSDEPIAIIVFDRCTSHYFILTFHDSIFECVARSFDIHIGHGSIKGIIPKMAELAI